MEMNGKITIDLQFQNTADSGMGRVTAAARLLNNGGIGPRTLDCYAFVYVIRGGGWFRDALGTEADLRPGSAFLLFPGVEHSYFPAKGETWDELYFLFEGAVFDMWCERGLLDPYRPVVELDPVELWSPRITDLWSRLDNPLDQVCRVQQFFVECGFSPGTQAVDDKELRWLEKARSLLVDAERTADGVADVAREMGMSGQMFRKTFSRMQGCPPSRFQTLQVMELAARRLHTESVSVKELALELGFCDEFHFSRRFKELIGISPKAYRARLNAS